MFLARKDLHVEKGQQVADRFEEEFAGNRQIFLPFDANNRDASMNLWSIARSCDSWVVPWFLVYERRSDVCVNSMDQLLKLFLSRIVSPVLLVRVRRGYSSEIGCPADMTPEEFMLKIGSLYGANAHETSCR